MNPADPRWLEILKATGWQNLGICLAFSAFIYLVKVDVIPASNNPFWISIPAIIALVCGGLAVAAFGDSASKFTARLLKRW